MRFKEAYGRWQEDRLTQEEAALILGVSDRTFRRYICRYEDSGLEGLADRRLTQTSHRCAPVDEVVALVDLYSSRHQGGMPNTSMTGTANRGVFGATLG